MTITNSTGENFGSSVSFNGDSTILAIGAMGRASWHMGFVSIYRLNNGTWETNDNDKILGSYTQSFFGWSVQLNATGNILVVGAKWGIGGGKHGYVKIYKYDGSWNEMNINTVNGNSTIITGNAGLARFGWSLCLRTNDTDHVLAICSFGQKGGPEPYISVYELPSGENVWIQKGNNFAFDNNSKSGNSVSINKEGNLVAFGSSKALQSRAYMNGYEVVGEVTIWKYENSLWGYIGEISYDWFQGSDYIGSCIDLNSDGTRIIIGIIGWEELSEEIHYNNGRTIVYDISNSDPDNWTQIGENIVGINEYDELGSFVSMDDTGDHIVVGSLKSNNGLNNGYVRLYSLIENSWVLNTTINDGHEIYGDKLNRPTWKNSSPFADVTNNIHISSDAQYMIVGNRSDEIVDIYSTNITLTETTYVTPVENVSSTIQEVNVNETYITELEEKINNNEITKKTARNEILNQIRNSITIEPTKKLILKKQELLIDNVNIVSENVLVITSNHINEVTDTISINMDDNQDNVVYIEETVTNQIKIKTLNNNIISFQKIENSTSYTYSVNDLQNVTLEEDEEIIIDNLRIIIGSLMVENVQDITSNICFLGDSIVRTDQGEFPIEQLKYETLHGKRFVRTKTKFLGSHLIVIEKDALGINIPNKTTIITPEHKVFIKGVMTEAKKLINNDTIYKRKYKGEYVYNILQEEHTDMYVNNMLCETLDPTNSIRKLYTKNASLNDIIEYNKMIKSLLR